MNDNGEPYQYRCFCFTSYDDIYHDHPNITYLVCQEEKCPKSGRYHLQGYCELEKKWTMSRIKSEFGNQALHIEMRRGSAKQAIDYCKKEESATGNRWEFGTPKSQGDRSDLKDAYEMVKRGMKNVEIAQTEPATYMKFYRAIDAVRNLINQELSKKWREVKVHVLWGKAGTGKTRYIYDSTLWDDIYKLDRANGESIWFDGYQGEKILLIDDFYGWIKYGLLLQLLDGYPMRLQTKGGNTWAQWETVYITSNKPWRKWYSMGDKEMGTGRLEPLERRITDDHHFGDPEEEEEEDE